MNVKNVFIFVAGVTTGGVGVELIHRVFLKSKEDTNVSKSYRMRESNSREDVDRSWTEADRKRVSEFLQDSTIVEPTELDVSTSVPSMEADNLNNAIQTMNESSDTLELSNVRCFEHNSDDKNDEAKDSDIDETNNIEYTSVIEFVKAAASGKQIYSFIFDPISNKFYWNFSYDQLTAVELENYIGKDVLNDIKLESETRVNSSISPKYLYDSKHDVYVKIESGVIL